MVGRDRHEGHRTATPLELLFDLTFVIAFGLAASQFAHALAEGHYGTALLGFGFVSFGICWAWTNFSWFASAYDTDDWIFRVATMVQMIGVLVLAIGVPRLFASIEHGDHLDNSILVLGYVIMRVALVFQWLRAARQDPARRRACLTYASVIAVAQVGWVGQMFGHFSIAVAVALIIVLAVVELAGPIFAERKDGGTPWHAHHIAERHGLFAIIALGEGVVGTVAALSAIVEQQGWTLDAAFVGIAGIGLTFGLWWIYYMLPSAADSPRAPRSRVRLGLQPAADRDGDRRHRRGPSCRRLLHRAQGAHQRAGDRAHRRGAGQRLSRIGLRALLLSGAALRPLPSVAPERNRWSRRSRDRRRDVGHQHAGVPAHPDPCAGRDGCRLRDARISTPGRVARGAV